MFNSMMLYNRVGNAYAFIVYQISYVELLRSKIFEMKYLGPFTQYIRRRVKAASNTRKILLPRLHAQSRFKGEK